MQRAVSSHPPAAPLSPAPDAGARALSAIATPERCANCGTTIGGHYCSQCGAPRLEERPLTVRRFASDLWNEVTSIDSGTLRTVRALFREPGRLTREYLDGRTRWYLSPLRLFLLTIAIYLFAHSALGVQERDERRIRTSVAAAERKGAARRAQEAAAKARSAPQSTTAAAAPTPRSARKVKAERILDDLRKSMTSMMASGISLIGTSQWLQLINPLAIAFALSLIYWRKRRNYAEHVVHALHLMSFVAILTAVNEQVEMWHGDAHHDFDVCFVLFWVILSRYFYLSARRVYGDSPRRTAVDAGLFVVGGQTAMFVLPLVLVLGIILWMIASAFVRIYVF